MENYIRLQRTGYGNADITRCFMKDIQKDLISIRPHLPKFCNRILDIGCGIGGIDLYLYNHFKGLCQLHMLDYNKTSESVYYGYKPEGAAYNSLDFTMEFLKINGVNESQIALYNAGMNEFPSCETAADDDCLLCHGQGEYWEGNFIKLVKCECACNVKFDIIISLLSCGFHYPVETYLDKIKAAKSGIVILDIRKNSGGLELLKNNFSSVEVIADYEKCERVLIR